MSNDPLRRSDLVRSREWPLVMRDDRPANRLTTSKVGSADKSSGSIADARDSVNVLFVSNDYAAIYVSRDWMIQ